MRDPGEYTPPQPKALPDDWRSGDEEQDELPPLDDDREEPFDEDLDELPSGADEIDPDISVL